MKRLHIDYFLLLFCVGSSVLFVQCKKEKTSIDCSRSTSYTIPDSLLSFFDFEVGSRWIYADSSDSTIKDTLELIEFFDDSFTSEFPGHDSCFANFSFVLKSSSDRRIVIQFQEFDRDPSTTNSLYQIYWELVVPIDDRRPGVQTFFSQPIDWNESTEYKFIQDLEMGTMKFEDVLAFNSSWRSNPDLAFNQISFSRNIGILKYQLANSATTWQLKKHLTK